MMGESRKYLDRLGFSPGKGGAHLARTMMLEDLEELLRYVDNDGAGKADFVRAIETDNCLRKRSGKTRSLTVQHLKDLYSLNPAVPLFRALLYYWRRDVAGRPLIALLCAYARDAVLRMGTSPILGAPEGAVVGRESLEEFLERAEPGRFSKATLRSVAQNINSTFTKSGHLRGRRIKTRVRPTPTPGAVSYALYLGYVRGARGRALLETEYAGLLDCSAPRAVELAEEASRRGWLVFNRIGEVMEVFFPNLLTKDELVLIHEPN